MSERKVTQKYYPPDFDPSKITKARNKPKNTGPKQITIRLMAPFSMQCTKCGEFIYKGRKFNARKESTTETYLDIPVYRFYIRCTSCSDQITFKTDPKHNDYICESGARRNFEPWREYREQETDEQKLDRLEAETFEEKKDVMQELETKVVDAKAEMAVADAIDELRAKNAKRNEISVKTGGLGPVSTRGLGTVSSRAHFHYKDPEAAMAKMRELSPMSDRLHLMSDEEFEKYSKERSERVMAWAAEAKKSGKLAELPRWDIHSTILPPGAISPEVAMDVYGAVNYGPGTDTPLSSLKPFQKNKKAPISILPKPQMTRPLASKPPAFKRQPFNKSASKPQAFKPQVSEPQAPKPQVSEPQASEPQALTPQVSQSGPKTAEETKAKEVHPKLAALHAKFPLLAEAMAMYASSSEEEDE